ncbi:Putative HhH-GPD domain, DNA glycosylase [Septoria linicola]|uniref:HhH-GPD domain, DNA glycosylase n=1 Tax=Septoria linicola TaxID=215465 RepID=A0A9Q9B548_9PEZI|nr:putative HhH-GPD domain, DNA glycosylase [Septoria linicola]USW58420.1 Putative HhH-GPD domain, DNA glycosylase [Septoria linicola]
MSLRRSARVSVKPTLDFTSNGIQKPPTVPTKRGRKRKSTEEQVVSAIQAIAKTTKTAKNAKSMPSPPATPTNKRRKVTAKNDEKPPPFTPTPSAIGLMTRINGLGHNYSTGDIDDPALPPTRPVDAKHTNATLVTPGGTQLQPAYSNFEDASPSKAAPRTTSKTLLDEACAHLIKVDSTLTGKLKPVIEKHHCRVFSPEGLSEKIDPFRSLASGIMAQQVSGAAASSIKNKFISLFPSESCPTGFPPPSLVAATDLTTLRTAGLSQRKAEYIQGLAQKFDTGEITTQQLMTGTDEDVMRDLVAVRGLGAWSVEMFMCFGLKRLDVFSTGDLGVQRGMAAYMGRDVNKLKAKGGGKWKYMGEKDMIELAENFRPYRSLFMWYMWRIEDVNVAAVQDNAEE